MVLISKRRQVGLKHILFATTLAFILFGSLGLMLFGGDPIILGTEMNANGQVEYMCLGNGCENYRDFHWVD